MRKVMKKLLVCMLFGAIVAMPFVLPVEPLSGVAYAKDAKEAKVTLHVYGMTCASCKVTVRVTLERLNGVKKAVVNVKEKRARVVYDPSKVSPQQMVEAVNKSGYKAGVASKQ